MKAHTHRRKKAETHFSSNISFRPTLSNLPQIQTHTCITRMFLKERRDDWNKNALQYDRLVVKTMLFFCENWTEFVPFLTKDQMIYSSTQIHRVYEFLTCMLHVCTKRQNVTELVVAGLWRDIVHCSLVLHLSLYRNAAEKYIFQFIEINFPIWRNTLQRAAPIVLTKCCWEIHFAI